MLVSGLALLKAFSRQKFAAKGFAGYSRVRRDFIIQSIDLSPNKRNPLKVRYTLIKNQGLSLLKDKSNNINKIIINTA
ncbi:MAG TPA: hypothetical protein DCM38_01185 [Gammaproteobacteria bacterium]|nr:hypothetical protein [Gammaproteobacteria bacterium]